MFEIGAKYIHHNVMILLLMHRSKCDYICTNTYNEYRTFFMQKKSFRKGVVL